MSTMMQYAKLIISKPISPTVEHSCAIPKVTRRINLPLAGSPYSTLQLVVQYQPSSTKLCKILHSACCIGSCIYLFHLPLAFTSLMTPLKKYEFFSFRGLSSKASAHFCFCHNNTAKESTFFFRQGCFSLYSLTLLHSSSETLIRSEVLTYPESFMYHNQIYAAV